MSRAAFANGLTAEENERLALLSEECAEVIQMIGKIHRHGFESTNPHSMTGATNRQLLEKELGDVDAAVGIMQHKGDVSASNIMSGSRSKLKKLHKWLHMEANLKIVALMVGYHDDQSLSEASPSAQSEALKSSSSSKDSLS